MCLIHRYLSTAPRDFLIAIGGGVVNCEPTFYRDFKLVGVSIGL